MIFKIVKHKYSELYVLVNEHDLEIEIDYNNNIINYLSGSSKEEIFGECSKYLNDKRLKIGCYAINFQYETIAVFDTLDSLQSQYPEYFI